MRRAQEEKDQLVNWLLHEGVQYADRTTRTYEHNGHTLYSSGEVRTAKVIDAFDVPYQTHQLFDNLREGDRRYTFRPDFLMAEPIKLVGCSHPITIVEYFGGNFLIHDDIRKMQALRAATGRRGHFILPGHLHMLEHQGIRWHDNDFKSFHAPGRAENFDEVSYLIMIDVLRDAGIEIITFPEFHNCFASGSERKFTFRGHIFFPQPQKFIGIDEPIQMLRCVKRLEKDEIIALESLHATRGVTGYALLRQFALMYRYQGLFKKRPQVPDKYSEHYQAGQAAINYHAQRKEPLIKRKRNGVH